MSASSTALNGCYVLTSEGEKFPISRSLARAIQRVIADQKNQNGSITIHLKSGGVSSVEVKTVYHDSSQ